MQDAIIIIVLACIVGAVVFYLYRQKKQGAKCIGCPYSKECSGKCGSNKEK